MLISGFHIDGFGIFHDRGVQDIPGGFVLLSGPNESGKTTLMEFFRAVLFGFPDGRSKRNRYEPLRGGNHGGRLKVTMKDGRVFTIERLGKNLTVTGGDEDEARLEELLGGIDRPTFESIFAINARDLQGLKWLAQDNVRGRLLAASTGTGAESVPSTLESLAKEMENLLKRKGATRPLVNKCVNDLMKLNGDIRELRTKPTEYAELQQERAQLEEQINRKRKTLEWLKELERQREARGHAIKAKEDCEDRIQRLESQLSEITVDEVIITHKEAIRELMGEKGKLTTELAGYPEVVEDMRKAEKENHENIKTLGAGWDMGRIMELGALNQMRQSINDFESRLDAAERDHELKQDRQQTAESAEKKAKLALDEAQQNLDALAVPTTTDKQELDKKQKIMGEMRSLLHQRETRKRQQAERARLELLEERMQQQMDQSPSKAHMAMFAVGGVGMIVTIVLLILNVYIPGGALGALSIAGLGLGIRLYNRQRRRADDKAEQIAQLQSDIQGIDQADQKLSDEMEELETQLASIAEQMEALSQKLGIQKLDDVDELEELESELRRETEQLNEWLARSQRRNEAEENCQAAREQLSQMTQGADDAHREFQRVELEWQKWVVECGFTEAVSPSGFRDILGQVAGLQGAEKARRELKRDADRIKAYLAEVRTRIHNELSACDIEPSGDEVGEADLDALDQALNAALEEQRKRDDLKRQLSEAGEDMKKLSKQIDEKQAAVDDLNRQASAVDEEELHRILKLDEQRLKEHTKKLSDQVSTDDRAIGGLKTKLEQMAQDEELAKLLFTRQALQAELKDLTKRWATLAVCRHLVNQTRIIYEKERQPKVIQEAGRFTKIMTGMPYDLVMPVGKSDDIQVEDETTARKGEVGWSSGLADQIYLSMRLACAQDLAENAEPLPLILDDVLLTFDPDRQLGAAKVILDLAQRYQVLMFTCQPGVREITQMVLADCDFRDNVNFACYTISNGTISRE